MNSIKTIIVSALMGGALALPSFPHKKPIDFPSNVGCGEVNVFYTGFAAYHPMVIEQGYDPAVVDVALRNETANLVKAGFNVRVLFEGPEQPMSNIVDRLEGTTWGIDAIGWGVRGAGNGDITHMFEDLNILYRENLPNVPTVYNWGPNTLAESVTRRVALTEDCTDKPGKLIAYEEVCAPELCEKVTVVTNGSLEDLLEGVN